MKPRARTILLTLTRDENGRCGYTIDIDGRRGSEGSGGTALDSYRSAIRQLGYNDDNFPIDCPNPFMTEAQLDSWLTKEIEARRRPEPTPPPPRPTVDFANLFGRLRRECETQFERAERELLAVLAQQQKTDAP